MKVTNKQVMFYDEAKRLYVEEGLSIDSIRKKLKNQITRKTLYEWKAKGGWDEKRKEFLKEAKDISEQLVELSKLALKNALTNPTPHNIYAVMKAITAYRTWHSAKLEDMLSKNNIEKTELDLKELLAAVSEQVGES